MGDESSWLVDVATVIGGGAPTLTVLINGGAIAAADAARSVTARRPVVVVSGTGRTADQVLHDAAGAGAREVQTFDARAAAGAGLLTALDPTRPVPEQRDVLASFLDRPAG